MQKTNFRFEAIVHDDASTDGTAAIVREYADKYPDIIKPIYETENQYSKGDGSLQRIMDKHTQGKYVAFCEGDDYWTDPLKLQKQVNFLENHPDYTMCFHNVIEHFEDSRKKDRKFSNIKNRDYQDIEIYRKWIIQTASVMCVKTIFTTEIYNRYICNKKIIYGDTPLFLTCCHYGKIRGFSDVMSVYRKNSGGQTAVRDINHIVKLAQHNKEIPNIFGEHLRSLSEYKYILLLLRAFKYSFLMKKWSEARVLIKEAYKTSFFKTFVILIKNIL